MWSITNYFVLNLSLADILLAGLNCSFSFLYMRDRPVVRDHHHGYYGHHFREWKFGGAYCSINQFISVCSVSIILSVSPYSAVSPAGCQCPHHDGHHSREAEGGHLPAVPQDQQEGSHRLSSHHLDPLCPHRPPTSLLLHYFKHSQNTNVSQYRENLSVQ